MKPILSLTAFAWCIILQIPLLAQQSALNAGNWYRFTTSQKGVHKISYEDLAAAGVLSAPLSSSWLAMFSNGPGMLPEQNWLDRPFDLNEIHIAVFDQQDGIFGPGDYLLFYGTDQVVWNYNPESGEFEHTTHLYDNKTHFFLTLGQGDGLRIEAGNNSTPPVTHETSTFTDYQLHQTKTINFNKSGKKWFGEDFTNQSTLEFSFEFPFVVFDPAICHVNLVSRSVGAGNYNIFSIASAGTSSDFEVINVSNNWLNDIVREGNHSMEFIPNNNEIQVALTLNPANDNSQAWINFIRVQAQRQLNMNTGGQVLFRNSSFWGEPGATSYTLENFTADHQVWEITDFGQPQLMLGNAIGDDLFTFVQDHNLLREYVCFSAENTLTPEFQGAVGSQNLKGQPHAQGFIVTHPNFLAQAEQLAAFHETHSNLSVNVATTEQIYNEFSGGTKDITAIKDYMRYFYMHAESDEEKPQYLCLLGSASYDYLGYEHPGTDLVPTFQSENSYALITSYCSDDYYGLLDQDDSNLLNDVLDLRIGRLPARDVYEAQVMIDKIIQYTANENPGDWQNNALFVADDEDNNIHMSQSNQLSTLMSQNRCDLNIHRLYFDAFEEEYTENGPRYPEATQRLLNRIDAGVLFCNYTGHSGHSNWSAELVLLDTMIEQLQNSPQLPLFFMANCEFSRFDSPLQVSGSQLMLNNPAGGAIACISNSRVGYSSSNFVFNNNFNNKLFERENGQFQRLGDLIMDAKNASLSINVMSHRSINLLGDPMLRLNYPELIAEITQISGSPDFPDEVVAQQYQDLHIEGQVTSFDGTIQTDFNGILNYLVLDAEVPLFTLGNNGNNPYSYQAFIDTLAAGSSVVENGEFSFSAPILNNSNGLGGQGKLILFANSDDQQASGCFTEFISEPAPLNVLEFETLELNFYPNPVQHLLRVETHDLLTELEYSITDASGKVLMSKSVGHAATIEIDFSAFSAGMYILSVQSEDRKAVARVVKTN